MRKSEILTKAIELRLLNQSLVLSFMSTIRVILLFVALAHCALLTAQSQSESESVSASESDLRQRLIDNNKVIKTMLDYRYKGGSGAFERDFFLHVDYNKISRQSCTIGTTIMMFTVHCDGSLGEFNIINPLNDYLNSQLQKFFLMTKDKWNQCQNSDYEYFEIYTKVNRGSELL